MKMDEMDENGRIPKNWLMEDKWKRYHETYRSMTISDIDNVYLSVNWED